MDVKQIEYIVKIADERSITRAAEKLYLTQSALNQQLLRLERSLGAPLFYRSKSDWRPTPIGEVYLENARKILRIKHDTYNIIGDMVETKKGRLSIGFTPDRGSEMFIHVYPAFHRDFPTVTVEPHELRVRSQQALIDRGDLDIGFQTLSEEQKTNDEYIILGHEEIFLVIPDTHPLAGQAASEHLLSPAASLSLFREEPFVLMYRESTIRPLVDDLFRNAGFTPNVLFETASNITILSMVQSRQCCGILPQHYIRHHPDHVIWLPLTADPTWSIVASYRRNSYLSTPAKAFISLAKKYWIG